MIIKIKPFILILCMFCIKTVFSQEYTVNGIIDKQYDGKYVNLYKTKADSIVSIENVIINDGKFSFEGYLDKQLETRLNFGFIYNNGKELSEKIFLENVIKILSDE